MFIPEESVAIKKRYTFRVKSQYDAEFHATLRDVTDTIHVALARLRDIKGPGAAEYDDALHVYAEDDGIVFYFDVTEDE